MEALGNHANPYAAIKSPFTSSSDIQQGQRLFQQHCGACHGADARGGGNGPQLAGVALRRANSDWATYKIITHGIAGTSMPPHALPWKDSWHLVSFVRSLAPKDEVAPVVAPAVTVPATRIADAASHPEDWLTYSGGYDGQRFSGLDQITAANVAQLQIRWLHRIDTDYERVLAVPLVSDGVMYFTAPLAKVFDCS